MRIVLVLTVLLVAAVCSSDAWGIRSVWRKVKPMAIQSARCYVLNKAVGAAVVAMGKRSTTEFDSNADGFLDQQELESFLTARDASDLLQISGNDKIDVEDFQEAVDRARRYADDI